MGNEPTLRPPRQLNKGFTGLIPSLAFFLKKNLFLKKKFKKIQLPCYTNNRTNISFTFNINNNNVYFFKSSFSKLFGLINTLFSNNKNIIIIDYNYNYNYLPLSNKNLLGRSEKNLQKLLTYFNIGSVIFLNLNKKLSLFKKLFKFRLINVSLNTELVSSNFDIHIDLPNTPITHYLVYTFILNTYLKIKNNNLNTNGAALFFFKFTNIHYQYIINRNFFRIFNLFFFLY